MLKFLSFAGILLIGLCPTFYSTSTNYLSSIYPVFFTADSVNLEDYVGMYTFTTSGSPLQTFHITLKDGELYGEADSYGTNKLLKQTETDKFLSTSSYGSTIIFVRDPTSKKVNGLQLIIQGNTLDATKNK